MKWHFQFTPHDTHDWDANHVPVLTDLIIGGQPRKLVMAGVMSTASGLVFAGDNEGNFSAFDAGNGQTSLALSDRLVDLGSRGDDLHTRRTPVRRHRVGEYAHGVRAATSIKAASSSQLPESVVPAL